MDYPFIDERKTFCFKNVIKIDLPHFWDEKMLELIIKLLEIIILLEKLISDDELFCKIL